MKKLLQSKLTIPLCGFFALLCLIGAAYQGNGWYYNASPITCFPGSACAGQTDINGYLKVNVAAGGSAPVGTTWLQDNSSATAASPGVTTHTSKASAATLDGLLVSNYSGGLLYFQVWNTASALTSGTSTGPVLEYPVGLGVSSSPTIFAIGAAYWGPGGLTGTFTTGLTWSLSSTSQLYTSVATGLASVEVDYK